MESTGVEGFSFENILGTGSGPREAEPIHGSGSTSGDPVTTLEARLLRLRAASMPDDLLRGILALRTDEERRRFGALILSIFAIDSGQEFSWDNYAKHKNLALHIVEQLSMQKGATTQVLYDSHVHGFLAVHESISKEVVVADDRVGVRCTLGNVHYTMFGRRVEDHAALKAFISELSSTTGRRFEVQTVPAKVVRAVHYVFGNYRVAVVAGRYHVSRLEDKSCPDSIRQYQLVNDEKINMLLSVLRSVTVQEKISTFGQDPMLHMIRFLMQNPQSCVVLPELPPIPVSDYWVDPMAPNYTADQVIADLRGPRKIYGEAATAVVDLVASRMFRSNRRPMDLATHKISVPEIVSLLDRKSVV